MVQDSFEERASTRVFRIGQNAASRPAFNDLLIGHDYDGVCDLAGKRHLMGCQQHGHSVPGQLPNHIQDVTDQFRVQR
jgi:hypothetical protein